MFEDDLSYQVRDFTITEHFAVVPDHHVVFKIGEMFCVESPVVLDESKSSCFGVLPKYARDASERQGKE